MPQKHYCVIAIVLITSPLLSKRENHLLGWSITFLILALIAAALGFGGIAGASAGIAKILFFVFLGLLIVSAILRVLRGQKPV